MSFDGFPWYYAPGSISGATLLVTMIVGQHRHALSAFVLFLIWAVCTSAVYMCGGTPWPFLIAVDLAGAAALIAFGGTIEAVLAISLGFQVLQLVAYGIYALYGGITPEIEWVRWWTAFYISTAQSLLVAGASIHGGGRQLRYRSHSDIAYSSVFHSEGGLEQALVDHEAEELIRDSR